MPESTTVVTERQVRIAAGTDVTLDGDLVLPAGAEGIVLFAHGSGSSRRSPRNRHVARVIQEAGVATLLFDLLTLEEERIDAVTAELRFDIRLLAARLAGATDWLDGEADLRSLSVGYFGSSTGGGAALVAAAGRPERVAAVVSRGGRPDLAGDALPRVQAPTLLIVGALDTPVLALNREAMERLGAPVELEVVAGATHLFEEPGKLDEVARLAAAWFARHLCAAGAVGAAGPLAR